MEKLQSKPTGPQAEAQVVQKRPYAPPKLTFVPLKPEERLFGSAGQAPGSMSCGKGCIGGVV